MRKAIYWLVVVGCVFFATSQPQAATILNYEYDANGSMTSGDGKYIEYNDANQLVRVRHGDANGPVIAEYVYDFNGQRIKKVENGVTTYYVGKHFEQEVVGQEQTTASYYFANGERVAKKESGVLEYYHSDHLGGTNAVTDVSANIVERMNYFPFGEMREGGGAKYSYTGKERDTQTDWYYYEARFYSPELKHFTQADDITPDYDDPQDLNRFAYVRNGPINRIDPNGRDWVDSAVNFASNTKVGSWMGDQTLKMMGAGSVKNASPEVQVAFYGSLAEGLDHSYAVTKKTSGKAFGAVFSLFTEGPKGTISDIFDMSIILAEEFGTISKESSKNLGNINELYSLFGSYTDIKSLGKKYQMNRSGYLNLVKSLGGKKYSNYLKTINKYKLGDKYKVVNGTANSFSATKNVINNHEK